VSPCDEVFGFSLTRISLVADFVGSDAFVTETVCVTAKLTVALKVFPKYFPDLALASQYAGKPERIANRVYANRMGNGSEESGDGYKYCGRGLIQVTGHDNYTWFAESIQVSPEEASEYMETFEGAAQSACWFWETANLNAMADRGDIKAMTKTINGGYIGLEDRISHYEHALHVLGV
jgi:putative chitinase